MSTEVVSILKLDKDLEGRVVLAKEIGGCDSSFITSCILAHQIRQKSPTLFITCHNPISHYHNIGLKMNYSLKRSIESQLITHFDLGEEFVSNLLEDKQISLLNIFDNIKKMSTLILQNQSSLHIIFDGLSHLFDMQFSLKDIVMFVRNLIFLVRECSDSYLLLQSNIAHEDDVTNVMANFVSHMTHTVVEVVNLPTGLSADVSGHLIVKHSGQKFETEFMHIMNPKPSLYHFKLFDKGVKLFAPGIV